MEKIIEPVSKELLIKELQAVGRVRKTNKAQNEIYIVTHHDSPNVMMEIGRLREITFRHAGGGTGKSFDIDDFDTSEHPYKQLLVWDPADQEIVGAYRFIKLKDAEFRNGKVIVATTELFEFSERFYKEFLPVTIELGRSWVQPAYQPSETVRKGLFTLDNLWDGLGAVVVDNPDQKYYYGKVTMYSDFDKEARDMIISFMHYYFPDKDNLVWPIHPINYTTDVKPFLEKLKGLDYKEGHAVLNKLVRERGENIPPLVNTYMNTSPIMRTFGTAGNPGFGNVEETGIMIAFADAYPPKRERHIGTYLKEKGMVH
ncbi:MAG: GNAT family N-acetyltransferase [Bacteroidia bacterium]|nr:GNAT family N-acetyltransferase [Bacteroidia bacterium]